LCKEIGRSSLGRLSVIEPPLRCYSHCNFVDLWDALCGLGPRLMPASPVAFVRVMFAPKILVLIPELAEYYETEIGELRVIAKDPAITAELWIRSKHGTWRLFLVTPSTLVEIDREGKRIVSGQTIAYLAGIAVQEKEGDTSSSS